MGDLDPDIGCLLYADDLKLFFKIHTVSDCRRLQQNLDRVVRWCSHNRLLLNPVKCHVMSFSLTQPTQFDYSIGGSILARPKTCCDLGVIFDLKLSFVEHVSGDVSTAYRSLGFIVRKCRVFVKNETLAYSSMLK